MENLFFRFGTRYFLITSAILPLLGYFFLTVFLPEWSGESEPLHLVLETIGALIAVTVAILLILQMQTGQEGFPFVWITSGLVGMGVLDAFHSWQTANSAFVWTRSMGMFVGGACFSLAWLPARIGSMRFVKLIPLIIAILAAVTSILSLAFLEHIPPMVIGVELTRSAKIVNLLGGLFFFAAAFRFISLYRADGVNHNFWFSIICLLFAEAGVLFANSRLWDVTWWYWHALRLLAYFVLLGYAFTVYSRLHHQMMLSEARSRALLNTVPDLIARFYPDGTLLDFHAPRSFLERSTLPAMTIGSNIRESAIRSEVIDGIMRASEQGVRTGSVQTLEFVYPGNEELRHYEARILASEIEVVTIIRDITERKRTLEQLRNREIALGAILETIPCMTIILARNYTILYFNPFAEKVTGYRAEEVLGKNYLSVFAPDDSIRELIRDSLERMMGGETIQGTENAILHKDGSHVWVSWHGQCLREYQGQPVALAIGLDISQRRTVENELRRSHEELRRLAGRLISAREEETRRLARELHDALSQRLAVLGMEAAVVETRLAASSDLLEDPVHKIVEDIRNLSRDVHQISRLLHPSLLYDLGLKVALQAECSALSRMHGIEAQLVCPEEPEALPDDISLSIYRIAQESLWNVVKHSQAKSVRLDLSRVDEEIVLAVEDDGIGFDPVQRESGGGLGLVSMEERARLVQGSLTIHSESGKGTRVEVRIPFPISSLEKRT